MKWTVLILCDLQWRPLRSKTVTGTLSYARRTSLEMLDAIGPHPPKRPTLIQIRSNENLHRNHTYTL